MCHADYMPTNTDLSRTFEEGLNPIRVIRNELGLSIRQAADQIGCHHQALFMNECGAAPSVFPVVLDWLVARSEFNAYTIENAYDNFVCFQRKAASERFDFSGANISDLGSPSSNPVRAFRDHYGLSRAAFCKTLCLSTSLLYSVEVPSAVHVAATVPGSLLDVLHEVGVPTEVTEELVERYLDWRAENVRH